RRHRRAHAGQPGLLREEVSRPGGPVPRRGALGGCESDRAARGCRRRVAWTPATVRSSPRGRGSNPTRLAASLLVVTVLGCAPAPSPAAPPGGPAAGQPVAAAATSAAPTPASGAAPTVAGATAPLQHVTIGVNNALSDAPFFLAD